MRLVSEVALVGCSTYLKRQHVEERRAEGLQLSCKSKLASILALFGLCSYTWASCLFWALFFLKYNLFLAPFLDPKTGPC
jgi:hypothetical protein